MNKVARFFALLSLGWCAAEEQCHGSQRATSLMQMKSINSKQTHQGSLRASLMYFQKFTAELVRDFEAGNARVASDREDTIKEVVRFIEDMWSSFVYPTYQDITTRVSTCTMKSMTSWTDGSSKVISGTDLDGLSLEKGIAETCWEDRQGSIEGASGVEVRRAAVDAKKVIHKQCRESRANICTRSRQDNCTTYDEYRWYNSSAWLSDASYDCSKSRDELFSSVQTIDTTGVRAEMEYCLEKTKAWLDPLYEKYIACDASYKKGEMSNDCEAAKDQCDDDQHAYELEACLYISEHNTECTNLESCLNDKITGCSGVCTDETQRIAETNTDNETGETILCLLAAIFNEQEGTTEGFVDVTGSDAYNKSKDEEWLVRKAKVNWCKGQGWSQQLTDLNNLNSTRYPDVPVTELKLKTSLNRYLDRTHLYTDEITFQDYTNHFKKELCACDNTASCYTAFGLRFPELDAFSLGTTLSSWTNYTPGDDATNASYTTLVSSDATNGDFGNNRKPSRRTLYTGSVTNGGLPCNFSNWGAAWDRPESSNLNGDTTDWEQHYLDQSLLLELPECDSSVVDSGTNMLFHSLEAKCWGGGANTSYTTDCTTQDDRLGKCCKNGGACNNAYVFTRRERCLAGGCRPDSSTSAAHLAYYGSFDSYTSTEYNNSVNSVAHSAGEKGTLSRTTSESHVDPFEWTISSDLQGAWKVVRRTDDLLDTTLLGAHCTSDAQPTWT